MINNKINNLFFSTIGYQISLDKPVASTKSLIKSIIMPLIILLTILIGLTSINKAQAVEIERATKEEAVEVVKKGIADMKKNGNAAVFKEVNDQTPTYRNKDAYLAIVDANGISIAHGANNKRSGKNILDIKDANGVYYVKEKIELAKTKSSFWHDYMYLNPLNKKIESKSAYCEVYENLTVCSGIYK